MKLRLLILLASLLVVGNALAVSLNYECGGPQKPWNDAEYGSWVSYICQNGSRSCAVAMAPSGYWCASDGKSDDWAVSHALRTCNTIAESGESCALIGVAGNAKRLFPTPEPTPTPTPRPDDSKVVAALPLCPETGQSDFCRHEYKNSQNHPTGHVYLGGWDNSGKTGLGTLISPRGYENVGRWRADNLESGILFSDTGEVVGTCNKVCTPGGTPSRDQLAVVAEVRQFQEKSFFQCLIEPNRLLAGLLPAECTDKSGVPFAASNYSEAEIKEREWRAEQGIPFTVFLRSPDQNESGTCAAPSVKVPTGWQILKKSLEDAQEKNSRSKEATIRFEGNCWPNGQWWISGVSKGSPQSQAISVPKKTPVSVRIISDGVIVFDQYIEKPQGEILISASQSAADKEIIALNQKYAKQALELREEIRLAEEEKLRREEAEKKRIAEEERSRKEKERIAEHTAIVQGMFSLPLSDLSAYLKDERFSDLPQFVEVLNTWVARRYEKGLNERGLGNEFKVLRELSVESNGIPLERITDLPEGLYKLHRVAWDEALADVDARDADSLEEWMTGIPLLSRSREIRWFFEKSKAGKGADYSRLRQAYILKRVKAAIEAGLSMAQINRSIVDRIDEKEIDLEGQPAVAISVFPIKSTASTKSSDDDFDLDISVERGRLIQFREEEQVESVDPEGITFPSVLYRISDLKIDRKVIAQESIGSKYIAGYQEVSNPEYEEAYREAQKKYQQMLDAANTPNPAYSQAQAALRQAEKDFEAAESQYGVCLGMKLGGLFSPSAVCTYPDRNRILYAQSRVNSTPRTYTPAWSENAYREAQRLLSSTPRTISAPVYQPYQFRKARVQVSRTAVIEIFSAASGDSPIRHRTEERVIDRQEYSLVYGVHEKDPDKGKFLRGTSSEAEIQDASSRSASLNLSELMLGSEEDSTSLASIDELKEYLITSKAKPADSALVTGVNVETTFIQDKRLRSVVIVKNLSGGFGSGFFVGQDLILTNYHVIEGTSLIEIEDLAGTVATGLVVAKDIRLDLALVKVDLDGDPVEFSDGIVALGDTVHAIGHPRNMTYTLTQGIISSLRRLPSMYDPGGPPVLFVQTDVAISPGNSGGPLYHGNKVVAVNTWKMVSDGVEGLAFSVHVAEVMRFLEEFRDKAR